MDSFSMRARVWTPEDRRVWDEMATWCQLYGIQVIVSQQENNYWHFIFRNTGDAEAFDAVYKKVKQRHAEMVGV